MAAKKYYAVKKGITTGIFDNWADCKAAVDGYSGAEYKGFTTLLEARQYLGVDTSQEASMPAAEAPPMPVVEATADAPPIAASEDTADTSTVSGTELMVEALAVRKGVAEDTLLTYVDGSYQHALAKYAFGCVFILPGGKVYTVFGNGDQPESLKQRNVAGEMLGAMYAVKTAMKNGFAAIELRYDYEGIEKWVTGAWRSKTELTQKYAQAMRDWGRQIGIRFTKVPAHSNVFFNELADALAKQGLEEGCGVPAFQLFSEMTVYGEE